MNAVPSHVLEAIYRIKTTRHREDILREDLRIVCDAAQYQRAPAGGHVTAEGDALLCKISVLRIYRDTYPDGPDLPDQRYEILPADVRTARTYVEARDASSVRPAWLSPAPATAPSVARMRDALEQCARWFAEYAESHSAQGKTDKAQRNMDRANFARAVLAETGGGPG